jgi:hypothetical protein
MHWPVALIWTARTISSAAVQDRNSPALLDRPSRVAPAPCARRSGRVPTNSATRRRASTNDVTGERVLPVRHLEVLGQHPTFARAHDVSTKPVNVVRRNVRPLRNRVRLAARVAGTCLPGLPAVRCSIPARGRVAQRTRLTERSRYRGVVTDARINQTRGSGC